MVLDGGPISLGAEIIANGLWMRSYGTISNLGFPMPITLTGNRFSNFDYFNAVGGVIGAEERADFTGTPNHSAVGLLPSNRPCIVTFNGVTIVDCNTTSVNIRELFLSLPKNLWYITWLYSSWDNLSNPEFFVQEPVNLGMNPRDLTTFYRKALLYRTDPLLEESVLKLEKVTPQEELAEWEFTVEFPEEAVDLDMPH